MHLKQRNLTHSENRVVVSHFLFLLHLTYRSQLLANLLIAFLSVSLSLSQNERKGESEKSRSLFCFEIRPVRISEAFSWNLERGREEQEKGKLETPGGPRRLRAEGGFSQLKWSETERESSISLGRFPSGALLTSPDQNGPFRASASSSELSRVYRIDIRKEPRKGMCLLGA